MAKDGPGYAMPTGAASLPVATEPAALPALDAHVRAAQRGDPTAAEQLYRHFDPRMRRYVRTHVHDGHAVADVVSEAWVQALAGMARFKGTASDFERWIITITRHRMIDHIREQVQRTRRDAQLDELVDMSSDADLETLVLEQLGHQRLWKALHSLPIAEAQAAIVYLAWDEPARDAGRLLGRTPRAVRTAAARARAKLRAMASRPASEPIQEPDQAEPSGREHDRPHQATGD